METNTRHFIERAERSLLTNQPNLALLYMKNALEHNEIDRFQMRNGDVEEVWGWFTEAMKPLVETFKEIGEGFKQVGKAFIESYGEVITEANKKETEDKQ